MIEKPETMMKINELRNRISRLTEELSNADLRALPLQRDLDALLGRDDQFNRLAADYENLATMKKEKLERFKKLQDKMNELESESPYWSRRRAAKERTREVNFDNTEEIKRVKEQLGKAYRSLRLTAYNFELISSDYLAELAVRPTFVRFLDTCQQRLTSSENELGDRRSELARMQRQHRTLVTNYNRRRDTLEKYSEIEVAETKAAERSKEATEKHQQRLQNQNNSLGKSIRRK